jgi:hypothetical protein
MVRRELKSKLIELEKRYAAAVRAKRNEADAPLCWARLHAIEVAAVVLHGEPKMEEPLRIAHSRMEEKLHKEFAAAAEEYWIRERGEKPNPLVREYLCQLLMFDTLHGANDNLKFERVFSKAPVWLLKFTSVEWDAKLLGFKLPKLIGAPALGSKARLERNKWPSLPQETIDAGGPCSDTDEPWERIIERQCRARY